MDLIRLSRGAPVRHAVAALRRSERWLGDRNGEAEFVRVGGIGFTAIRVTVEGRRYLFPISMPPGTHLAFGMREESEVGEIVRAATAQRIEITERLAPFADSEMAASQPPS
jgi:hypothetical protein